MPRARALAAIWALCVLGCGLLPARQPVHRASFGPPGATAALKTVVLVGPDFEALTGEEEPARNEALATAWQAEITAQWSDLPPAAKSRFALALPSPRDRELLLRVLDEAALDAIPAFDEKTGAPNPALSRARWAALGRFAREAGADGVLHAAWVALPAPLAQNVIHWDGVAELWKGSGLLSHNLECTVPALSLGLELVNRNGDLLREVRAGYRSLTAVNVDWLPRLTHFGGLPGLTREYRETVKGADELFQDRYADAYRARTAKLALGALAAPPGTR